jgi:hypothetical protein
MRPARAFPAWIFAVPLFRLLAVNLAIGLAAAAIMVGGLLMLNPYRIRDLIFSDASGGATFILLAFGFVVTFGSAAMGAAIMAIGRPRPPGGGLARRSPAAAVRAAAVRARST